MTAPRNVTTAYSIAEPTAGQPAGQLGGQTGGPRARLPAPAPLLALLLGAALAGCGGSQRAADDAFDPPSGPLRERAAVEGLVFGEQISLGSRRGDTGIQFGNALGGSSDEGADALPVNRFLWQASLDTLSFLPLASTDPFTGVIATDWSAPAGAPDERLKVTVYHVSPQLEASSLRVAVFREQRRDDGLWVPQPVEAETIARLENAILTRARQIRIAEVEGEAAAG